MTRPVPHVFPLVAALAVFTACDDGDAGESEAPASTTKGEASAKVDADPTSASDEAAPTEAEAEKQARQFIKDQRKKGCEMLPPALAAKHLGRAEADLRQTKVMGCIYSWGEGDQTAEARIMSIWVKKTEKSAKTWFKNMTASKTPEQLAADGAKIKEALSKSKKLDTKVEKKTANLVADMAIDSTSTQGVTFTDVPGLGDEARISENDGSVKVRVGNMIFTVSAYKGRAQPPLDQKIIMSRDVKKMTAESTRIQQQWLEETNDVRKPMSIALAKDIVASL